MSNDIQITLPLKRYLEALCGHREFAVISHEEGDFIKQVDPNEQVCHVERMPDTCSIYPIHEWKASAERLIKMRQQAEEQRKIYNLNKEMNDAIFKILQPALGGVERKVIIQGIQPMIDSNNRTIFQQLGLDETQINWIMEKRLRL